MELEIKDLKVKEDHRGYVINLIETLPESYKIKEVLLIVTKPNKIRGNHFHIYKKEWVGVLKGKAKFIYSCLLTDERKEMIITDTMKKIIRTPRLAVHAIKNVGKEDLWLIEVSNKPYDEADTLKLKIL